MRTPERSRLSRFSADMMQPGDIFFSKPVDASGWINVAVQNLRSLAFLPFDGAAFGRYSHVAVCVIGPLVIEALKNRGVKTSVYANQTREKLTYEGFRFRRGIDQRELNEAVIRILREKYQIIGVSVEKEGASFCSLSTQKLFARMKIAPFNSINRALTPIELYRVLERSPEWQHFNEPFVGPYNPALVNLFDNPKYQTEAAYLEHQIYSCYEFQRHIKSQIKASDDGIVIAKMLHIQSEFDDGFHKLMMSEDIPIEIKIKWLGPLAAEDRK